MGQMPCAAPGGGRQMETQTEDPTSPITPEGWGTQSVSDSVQGQEGFPEEVTP